MSRRTQDKTMHTKNIQMVRSIDDFISKLLNPIAIATLKNRE